MAYSKKTWKARQGLGLNKFSIDGATPVPVVNQPDSITQQGDALSAGNLNDLENRIANAFDDVENEKADVSSVTEIRDDLQSQIDQHEARIANLEQVAGEYVTSDMTDYSSVPTGKASFALVETMKGVSRVENNLIPEKTSQTINDITFTIDNTNNTVAMSGTASANASFAFYNDSSSTGFKGVVGHKYLVCGQSFTEGFVAFFNNGGFNASWQSNLNPEGAILTCSDDTKGSGVIVRVLSGQTINRTIKIPVLTDLTLYFNGGTIPTLAEIQSKYPELLVPRAYTAGEIVDATYTSVTSVGINIWVEEWEVGTINFSTGEDSPNLSRIRSKGYISVKPSTAYYLSCGTSARFELFFYDINKNYISGDDINRNASFTTPSNAMYMRFSPYTAYGATYLDDITIARGSSAVTYHPHMTDQLAIPSVTLKGAGSVSDTLDVESGEITRRIGSYTFNGTETPTYRGVVGTSKTWGLYALGLQGKLESKNIFASNGLYGADAYGGSEVGLFLDGHNVYVCVPYVNGNASDISAWFGNGIKLNYELATPSPDPNPVSPTLDNTLRTEGGGSVFTDADVDGAFALGFLNL